MLEYPSGMQAVPAQTHDAPIAQLDRASDYGSEGWGFKSSWAYFFFF
jgi:hypothetical protein